MDITDPLCHLGVNSHVVFVYNYIQVGKYFKFHTFFLHSCFNLSCIIYLLIWPIIYLSFLFTVAYNLSSNAAYIIPVVDHNLPLLFLFLVAYNLQTNVAYILPIVAYNLPIIVNYLLLLAWWFY